MVREDMMSTPNTKEREEVGESFGGEGIWKGMLEKHEMVENVSMMTHLIAFAIIGVLIRYGLEVLAQAKLFNDKFPNSALYVDLPTNMVGCFFMGWVGVAFKEEIWMFSKPLGEGLSVGLMGSITTFATWNQRVITLATSGHWEAALFGYIIGMEVVQMSLLIGVESAKMIKSKLYGRLFTDTHHREDGWIEDESNMRHINGIVSLVVSFCLCILLWGGSLTLLLIEERQERRYLWVACVVGPVGVWIRRSLTSLNGKGGKLKLSWLPLGTLCANLLAVILEPAISLIPVTEKDNMTMYKRGLQFGLLGCMSTVSSLVREIYIIYMEDMRSSAFAYALGTLSLGFILGSLFYVLPLA